MEGLSWLKDVGNSSFNISFSVQRQLQCSTGEGHPLYPHQTER